MVGYLRFGSILWLVTIFLCQGIGSPNAGETPTAFRLTVVPFSFPSDPDYGVFMADRIACELMRHAYSPSLQRRRFELIESDTLSHRLQFLISKAKRALPEGILQAVRQRVPATYLLTGLVVDSGIKTLHLKLIDLETGEFVWSGSVRDNPAWIWTGTNREAGDIPAERVRQRLGFGVGDVLPPPPPQEDLPRQILLQPLHTTSHPILAADCRLGLRNAMTQDGLFSLVPGEITGRRGEKFLSRLGATERRKVLETTLADAVLCGSVLMVAKGEIAHNVAVALRLVEVSTGRILWTGAAGGRRVWRWDSMTDMVGGVMAQLTEDLAQYGASAAETAVAKLLKEAEDGADWCGVGNLYLQRGLLRQAEEAFHKALAFPDALAMAHNGLGQASLRRSGGLKKAVASFQAAIQEAPEFLEPYCNLARGYLERGMTDGVKFAQQAIRLDPSYSLPHRVLGDWYARNEEYVKALKYYDTYVRLEPDDVDAAAKLGRSLLVLGEYDRIDQLVAPILRARPEATVLLPVVAMKEFRVRHYGAADRYYTRFLSQVEVREKQLYTDIGPILSVEQRAIYPGLSGRRQKVFVERFWREKDPNLATEVNERLLEHYGRVWTARKEFGQERYPWDRRGEVYIRYGEPDYRARSQWIPALTSPKVQEVKERVYAQLYRNRPEGELVGPVFPIKSDQGTAFVDEQSLIQAVDGGGGALSGRAPGATRDAYGPVTLQNDRSIVPWESWVYVDIGGGLVFDFTKELGGTSGYDFAPIPAIPPSNLKSNIRLVEFAPAIAFERAVSNAPDTYRQPAPRALTAFAYALVDFRTEGFKTRVDVAYSVPLSELVQVTDGSRPQVVLERAVALADSSYSRVYRQSKQVQFGVDSSAVASGAQVVDLVQNAVPPGLYHFTVTVRDVISGRVGTAKGEVRVEQYRNDRLQISDLMLADRVRETVQDVRFRRGGLEVTPKPDRNYTAPQNLIFYYEVYNLKKDAFGQVHYRVTTAVKSMAALSAAQRPFGMAKHPEVALTYDQVGDQEWERAYLEVDLKEARPGRNRLMVMIEDLNSGERVGKQTNFLYNRAASEKAAR